MHGLITLVVLIFGFVSVNGAFVGISNAPKAVKELPELTLENKECVQKAIDAKNLLIMTDYHGTLVEPVKRPKDTKGAEELLKKIAPYSDTVVLSSSPMNDLFENYKDVEGLTLASDSGLEVIRNKVTISSPNHELLEERKNIDELMLKTVDEVATERGLEHLRVEGINLLDRKSPRYNLLINRRFSTRLFSLAGADLDFIKEVQSRVHNKLAQTPGLLDRWEGSCYSNHKGNHIRYDTKGWNKGEYLKKYIKDSGKNFDFGIVLGDGIPDNPMFESANSHDFLTAIVDSSEHPTHKSKPITGTTSAQYRIVGVDNTRELIRYIASERKKKAQEEARVAAEAEAEVQK